MPKNAEIDKYKSVEIEYDLLLPQPGLSEDDRKPVADKLDFPDTWSDAKIRESLSDRNWRAANLPPDWGEVRITGGDLGKEVGFGLDYPLGVAEMLYQGIAPSVKKAGSGLIGMGDLAYQAGRDVLGFEPDYNRPAGLMDIINDPSNQYQPQLSATKDITASIGEAMRPKDDRPWYETPDISAIPKALAPMMEGYEAWKERESEKTFRETDSPLQATVTKTLASVPGAVAEALMLTGAGAGAGAGVRAGVNVVKNRTKAIVEKPDAPALETISSLRAIEKPVYNSITDSGIRFSPLAIQNGLVNVLNRRIHTSKTRRPAPEKDEGLPYFDEKSMALAEEIVEALTSPKSNKVTSPQFWAKIEEYRKRAVKIKEGGGRTLRKTIDDFYEQVRKEGGLHKKDGVASYSERLDYAQKLDDLLGARAATGFRIEMEKLTDLINRAKDAASGSKSTWGVKGDKIRQEFQAYINKLKNGGAWKHLPKEVREAYRKAAGYENNLERRLRNLRVLDPLESSSAIGITGALATLAASGAAGFYTSGSAMIGMGLPLAAYGVGRFAGAKSGQMTEDFAQQALKTATPERGLISLPTRPPFQPTGLLEGPRRGSLIDPLIPDVVL
tara:strand:- start:1210 stop:3051 length:1842 start_codon:yes stop_codon:yes gene_type:complete